MKTVLDQLRDMTVVVADTGDVTAVKRYQPIDCTTNPSLVLAALSDPASEEMIVAEIEAGRKAGLSALTLTDTLTVAVGARLSGWCQAASRPRLMRACPLTPTPPSPVPAPF